MQAGALDAPQSYSTDCATSAAVSVVQEAGEGESSLSLH